MPVRNGLIHNEIPAVKQLASKALLHSNQEDWKDPNEFRPERFLDSDGQFQRDDRCVPFSLGKRYCIGQVRLNSFALFDNYV